MSLRGTPEAGGGLDRQGADGLQTVAGERSVATAHRVRSLESRVSNIMALGLMCALGFALLAWYYSSALRRPARAAQSAAALDATRAQTEMPLPPLGPIPLEGPPILRLHPSGPPAPAVAVSTAAASQHASRAEMPQDPASVRLPPLPALPPVVGPAPPVPYTLMGVPSYRWAPAVAGASGSMPAPSPQRHTLDRRLSGPVFAEQSDALGSTGPQTTGGAPPVSGPAAPGAAAVPASSGAAHADALAELLTPSVTPAASARVLPTRSLLLPKGAFIDCTLETAIDSTLPGMTTCITATDTFGADGKVVLLERGSKLIGETRGEVQQGSARIFVLWTEARTPTGVAIPLASPGTDELGRSGLPGEVNRHFWERFGAAILVSIIDAGAQSAVQSGNGAVIYDPTATQDAASEVLKETMRIPPTVIKNQGDRIQVLVARDLDFRSVYELRTTTR